MKLGVCTAAMHDRSLRDALSTISSLGLVGAEINAGGFLPTPHLPVEGLLAGRVDPDEYLRPFVETGLPAAHPGGRWPAWHVNPWDSGYLDSLDYQWDDVAVPFWREIDALARDHDVKVCIEMHPQNIVFNPTTLQRLVDRTRATHVGAEMDPSHLFWQDIDPVAAIDYLSDLVFHAAAKDTRINPACAIHGVLDDRFTRIPPSENPTGLGGRHAVNRWPHNSSWDFVAVGRGHDVEFWSRFLSALGRVDPDMAVNIEHEDTELPLLEGLSVAASTLRAANSTAAQPA
jgi:sugar phosphate isomerase/epimerase